MFRKGTIIMINLCTTLALALVGCEARQYHPGSSEQGATWLIPGIEGQATMVKPVIKALRDSGYQGDIYTLNWGNPLLPFRNLCNEKYKQEKAQTLANNIVKYAQDHPHQPIDIIGYSAGAGLTIMAVEKLPPHVKVRNITLVHGAISPEYDLTAALANTSGSIKNVSSKADWLILGLGTTIFGTMDNSHSSSAGMVGFDTQMAVPDPLQRHKLKQIKWKAKQKRWGGHITLYQYAFNKKYVLNNAI
ncbi:MAG: hypothetical protein JW745_00690 [Sedimentisphaerales bacterium]|nr:hypothetical protein [Sedimentisphaerales bacterium]